MALFKEPKDSIKMYPREYKFLALDDASPDDQIDTKFLIGIIRRYRKDGLTYGILTGVCVVAAIMMVFAAINAETNFQLGIAAIAFLGFVGLGWLMAATPTIRLMQDYLDARWASRRKVEIIDEDDLKYP